MDIDQAHAGCGCGGCLVVLIFILAIVFGLMLQGASHL